MKIAVEEGRLIVSGRRGGAIHFANIAEVAAEKVGKVAYDEVFLIVREQSGDAVTLGELDDGSPMQNRRCRRISRAFHQIGGPLLSRLP